MLLLLHIENIAVIQSADIQFDGGFNVLTGETGAGKSIVVDALNAVLGGRTSRDLIRTGAKSALVSAQFIDLPQLDWFQEQGIAPDAEGVLLLQRELRADGKNTCRLNGRPVSLAQLRELGRQLLDIHGQHDGQRLLDPACHLEYLDSFGQCSPLLADYQTAYHKLTSLKKQMDSLKMDEAEKARRVDNLTYQIAELERADLRPGEDEALAERKKLLRSAGKIMGAVDSACYALFGSDETQGALDLVEEAAVIIEAQTVEKTVTLHKEIHHDGHCHVFGSPLHVRQVLQNLLGNAVKYNKVGGEIFLTSREIALTEDTVTFEFTVRDTGKGMSEAFQQRAFEPFAQEEASARSSYVGTGLGLAIVKELVEKMGGEITLQSEKNVGSTFTVRLTFKQDKDAQRADDDAHGGAVSIRGTKVLLVEDNDLNMEIAEFMLQNEGVVVTKAADGRQAVDAFAASKPGDIDVILMDVMMPVMDGLEAARRIRSLNRPDAKTIPIFAMTANAFADDAERSRQAGMNEHLTKPLDAQVLLKTIGKYRKQGK